jgi:hypothetical protein
MMKKVVHFAQKAEENADDKVEEGKTKVFFLFRVIWVYLKMYFKLRGGVGAALEEP